MAEIYRRLRAERRGNGRENLETPSQGGRPLKKRSAVDVVQELRQRVESMQRLWRESRGAIVRRRRKSIPWRQNSKPPDDLVKLVEAIEILRSEIEDRVAKPPRHQSRR